ncbi:MAG: amidohydrolase [Elusimicrobia bacterium]|nr:amidohydrolase [Elusimicrobiota bacterium]
MTDREALAAAVALRRAIHQHPELGHLEFETTVRVARALKQGGVPFRRHKPTGLVARLNRGRGPCVALRADMDALPLQETSALPYASLRPGVMHACGHDAHTAMLAVAAIQLKERGLNHPGTVKFLFQPNEEGSGGARQLLAQGAFQSPTVDAVFGLHVNPRLPAGTLGIKTGPLMAAVDRFTLTVRGEGGHGAYPHEGRDAVVMAAQIVSSLQSIVSRRVDPVEPAVLTVGTIQGGERFNILASSVTLTGTVRTLSEKWHRRMPQLIAEVANGVARAHGGRVELRYEALNNPVVNEPAMTALARSVAVDVVGARRVLDLDRPSMGGEDFSEYLSRAPGCFVYLGTGAGPRTRRPWHHASFVLHEPSMGVGIRFFVAMADRALADLTLGRR